jgi:membrane associated rhomboid family serine protease
LQGVKRQFQEGSEELGLPVWARVEAFPPAAEGFGWIDRKGGQHRCNSLDDLAKTIREDSKSIVDLVWTPESEYCRVPEEIEAFAEPIAEVRKRWAEDDFATAKHRMKTLGGGLAVLLAYMAFLAWSQSSKNPDSESHDHLAVILKTFLQSTSVGMGMLGFLIFAFIPWYQAQKRMREIKKLGGRSLPVIPLIRFETWLDLQKAPVTRILLVMVIFVALGQMFFDKAIVGFSQSVQSAGLVKTEYFGGQWWRLFTAPMLHGGIIHIAMNAMALIYLGKRLEVFARWPHVPMVFLFSSLVGGLASAHFYPDKTSVGASGGLMGWLGFLIVFETLHSRLVPKDARRRLLAGVLMTGLIGFIGYNFIDNAAHFGGLVAGMVYAGIVFPKSGSVLRPKPNTTDLVIGSASMIVIAVSGVYALLRVAGG